MKTTERGRVQWPARARRIGQRIVRGVAGPITSLLLPESCWATGQALERGQAGLSDEAREAICRSVLWPYCRACGATTGHGANHDALNPCPACARRDLGVQRIARVGTYDEPLGKLVRGMKFARHWELARIMAPFLFQAMAMEAQDGRRVPVDALVPVALHWRRRWSRGFNQSEELAREIARLSGWRMCDALRRVRPTREQSHLESAARRKENLRGAFVCVRPEDLAGKHVWLIDDVSTTGATIHAAATALRRVPRGMRPAGIYAAVVCVTDRTPVPEVV